MFYVKKNVHGLYMVLTLNAFKVTCPSVNKLVRLFNNTRVDWKNEHEFLMFMIGIINWHSNVSTLFTLISSIRIPLLWFRLPFFFGVSCYYINVGLDQHFKIINYLITNHGGRQPAVSFAGINCYGRNYSFIWIQGSYLIRIDLTKYSLSWLI